MKKKLTHKNPIKSDGAPEVEVLPPVEALDADGADDLAVDAIEVVPGELPEEAEEEESSAHPTLAVTEGDAKPTRASGAGLVRYDSLQAYLNEIAQYPALTREEEHSLAVRYKEHADLDAAYRLVVSNLRVVVQIAKEYQRAARSVLDLIQEGNIGLMEAVKNYDPYRNVRFPSYAVWWIRAYIIRYLIANWRLVKIGTTQAQRKLFFNLEKERVRLEREGFYPAPKLLAERLDVREKDIIEMQQRLGSPDVSVDAPVNADEGDTNLHGLLPTPAASAEEVVADLQRAQEIRKSMEEFAATLDAKEAAILRSRLLAEDKATLNDIAEQFSLSRERIRQLENRIKEKLKQFLVQKYGDSVLRIDFGLGS